MRALTEGRTEILLKCPRVDLNCRDREGWSLVFKAILISEYIKYRNEHGKEIPTIITTNMNNLVKIIPITNKRNNIVKK